MSFAAGITLLVVVVALVLLVANVAAPDVVLLGGVVALAVAGVVTPSQAFQGFANEGMLTVAALLVVAAGLRETGAVNLLTAGALGRPVHATGALARLVPIVLVSSAFLNNTTIVAALLPAVTDWGRRIGVPVSRLLIPLSYASILGGICTLIGTTTNLVVAGMVSERLGMVPGLHEPGMFELSRVGVPVAVLAGLMVVLLGPRLLPDRRPPVSATDDPRHYTTEVLVPEGSRHAGRTVEQAGLRHLPDAFLMEIVREDGEIEPAVDSETVLREGDRLVFVGDVDAMLDLQRQPGLAPATDQVFKLAGERSGRRIVEAVVSSRNPLVGVSIRDGNFRNRYHAVVIGVARAGERVPGRIGDIVLRTGDTLLLEAHPDFVVEQRTRTDFYLVSQVAGAAPPRTERALFALVVLGALVAVVTFNLMPIVLAGFVASGLMVVGGCVTMDEARRSLDLQVLTAIAAAFGIGAAMESSGLDVVLAQLAIRAGAADPQVALAVTYVVTVVMTEVVTNNAAAVLAFPLGLSLAESLGVSPMPFVFTVMVAASASFILPIGYQTNLMVYGPGGYRAIDYPRLGLPVSVLTGVITLTLVPRIWPL